MEITNHIEGGTTLHLGHNILLWIEKPITSPNAETQLYIPHDLAAPEQTILDKFISAIGENAISIGYAPSPLNNQVQPYSILSLSKQQLTDNFERLSPLLLPTIRTNILSELLPDGPTNLNRLLESDAWKSAIKADIVKHSRITETLAAHNPEVVPRDYIADAIPTHAAKAYYSAMLTLYNSLDKLQLSNAGYHDTNGTLVEEKTLFFSNRFPNTWPLVKTYISHNMPPSAIASNAQHNGRLQQSTVDAHIVY